MLNANAKHKKIPQVYSLGKTEASSSTQTENNVLLKIVKKKRVASLLFSQIFINFINSLMISSFSEEEFSEEDGNVSDVKVNINSSLVKTHFVSINYNYLLGKKKTLGFFCYL